MPRDGLPSMSTTLSTWPAADPFWLIDEVAWQPHGHRLRPEPVQFRAHQRRIIDFTPGRPQAAGPEHAVIE